jgi:hypothetical protein
MIILRNSGFGGGWGRYNRQKQIPFGNDRQKSKGKSNDNNNHSSFDFAQDDSFISVMRLLGQGWLHC